MTIEKQMEFLIGDASEVVAREELEAKLNNLPYVMESLVMECGRNICALVYPDMDRADQDGFGEARLAEVMELNRKELNRQVPGYAAVSRIRLVFEEFEKTPTKKIKRRLYNAFGPGD